MQTITPFLWFDNQAEEAMHFYVSVFKNSKVGSIARYGEGAPMPAGTAMSVSFTLDGQEFMALNGGPMFQFTPAVSFFTSCDSQAEVDELWAKLAEGGEPGQCGWIKDKFGLSWQIIPKALMLMLAAPDAKKSARAMQAMLKMTKIDIAKMKEAFDQE